MAIYEFEGHRPQIGSTTFVHPEATIIGQVIIGEGCYIGPGARLRGDWGAVIIGDGSNIQENCVIHMKPGAVVRLGPRSHIGHGAILHGPRLGEHVVVGMGAIIMDGVEIGDGACIGAGALVTAGSMIRENKLVLGVPAKEVADIDNKLSAHLEWATGEYLALPPRCFQGLKEIRQ